MKLLVMSFGSVFFLSACGGSEGLSNEEALAFAAEDVFGQTSVLSDTTLASPIAQAETATGSAQYNGFTRLLVDAISEDGVEGSYEALGSFQANVSFGDEQNITAVADDFVEIFDLEFLDEGFEDFENIEFGREIEASFDFNLDIVQSRGRLGDDIIDSAGIAGVIEGNVELPDGTTSTFFDTGNSSGGFVGGFFDDLDTLLIIAGERGPTQSVVFSAVGVR